MASHRRYASPSTPECSMRVAAFRRTADGLRIVDADSFMVLLDAATSFRRYDDVSGDPVAAVSGRLDAAARKSVAAMLAAHEAEHQRLYRRLTIDLGTTPAAALPTDERIALNPETPDPALAALYVQYARYLMIASSRPGTQAANLQGIWNKETSPPWGSKYTTNINLQMNYWLPDPANLAECFEPLDRADRGGCRDRRAHGAQPITARAAGCCTTTPICGERPGPSTAPNGACGRRAARGSARSSGITPPSRAIEPWSRASTRCSKALRNFSSTPCADARYRLPGHQSVVVAGERPSPRRRHLRRSDDGQPDPARSFRCARRSLGDARPRSRFPCAGSCSARPPAAARHRKGGAAAGMAGGLGHGGAGDRPPPCLPSLRALSELPDRLRGDAGTGCCRAALARNPRRQRHRLGHRLAHQSVGAARRRRPRP